MTASSDLWLIGSGAMAQAYAIVLQSQNISFRVIGRGQPSATAFYSATGIRVICGGLDAAISDSAIPDTAIVAVGVEQLYFVAKSLIVAGCRRILVEKPGALHIDQLEDLYALSLTHDSQVWIAYNRRFYASVRKLRERVITDGGATSAAFEFSEWSHKIRPLQKAPGVKDRWLLANSSHVLDLAFSLVGLPADGNWHGWHRGLIDWHLAGAQFHGAGLTELGIPFSYHADWEAPGRWGIEISTRKYRYILRPLEELQEIPLGSIAKQTVNLDDQLDKQYKPGIYLQCQSFIENRTDHLCSLKDQLKAFPVYARIAGYSL